MAAIDEHMDDVAEELELPSVFTHQNNQDESSYAEEDLLDDRDFGGDHFRIPDQVVSYLRHLARHLRDRNVYELTPMYENGFNRVSENFFAKDRWPEPVAVARVVSQDPVFLTLYKELYYRHVVARLQVTLEDRLNSWENYVDLFNYILGNNGPEPVSLELPNQWLWDLIDEFIYQWQSFCNWRNRIKNKTTEEIDTLIRYDSAWDVRGVLNVLYSLIDRSKINEQLLATRNGEDAIAAAGEFGQRPLYKMLGYFSIVGLLRVHCLLGDYHLALSYMAPIDLHRRGLFARVSACYVTCFYYVGFAYMMMRRYNDAIKAFVHILLFIQRTKQYHTKSYQYNEIVKKSDQMYALVAICVALSPQRVDENVHMQIRERYPDLTARLTRGTGKDKDATTIHAETMALFEDMFQKSCPKFVSPLAPDYDNPVNTHIEPTKHQVAIFLKDVQSMLLVPNVRSYLKLYTTLEVSKLADLLSTDDEEKSKEEKEMEAMRQLMVYKHKTKQRRWESGELLSGEWGSASDLDFYIVKDMIHISESKVARRVGEWFVKLINKMEDIITTCETKTRHPSSATTTTKA